MLTLAHAWSRKQKLLIVTSATCALLVFTALIYTYERYYRGPTDAVLVGTWELQDGCIDCTHWITLQPNHSLVGFMRSLGEMWPPDMRGKWYAGGQVLVLHIDTAEEAGSVVVRILDISPDVIRVRWGGREMRMIRSTQTPPQASNQAMQRTADRPYA